MFQPKYIYLAAFMCAFSASSVHAQADFRVPDGGTLSQAATTANASSKDGIYVIEVGGGERTDSGSFQRSKGVKISGADDGTTIINGSLSFKGGMRVYSSSIENVTLNGGGIYNGDGSKPSDGYALTLDNVNIKNKISGGAIISTGALTINGGSFRDNKTGANGGGAILTNSSLGRGKIAVDGTIFENNYASGSGGAINNVDSLTTLKNATFTGNNSILYGGALYFNGGVKGDETKDNIIDNTTFDGNFANAGGAIYMNSPIGHIEIKNSTFKDNHTNGVQPSSSYGGAISITGGLDISDTEFTGNKAQSGGAIDLIGGNTVTITGGTFSDNEAVGFRGGAIYQEGSAGNLTVSGTEFIGNKVTGSSQYGGAIFIADGNVIKISGRYSDFPEISSDTVFSGNEALNGFGGAIYTGADIELDATLGNIIFSDNKAQEGNDIYLDSAADLNVVGTGGKVSIGGGIANYNDTSTITMSSLGVFEFGADSKNTDFNGTFNASAGTANIYANNWITGENFITNGAVMHFFENNETGSMDVSTEGVLDIRSAEHAVAAAGDFNSFTATKFNGDNTGIIMMSTDGSDADRLIISGAGAGGAFLSFTPIGSSPVSDEIKVVEYLSSVDVNDRNAAFSLYGPSSVEVGAWLYGLSHGGSDSDDDWYLKKTGELGPTAQTIAGIPAAHLSLVKTGMNELRKRLGALRNNNQNDKISGVWLRGYAKNMRIHENSDANLDVFGFEGGIDGMIEVLKGKVYLGIMAGTIESHDINITTSLGDKAGGMVRAPSIGVYATWMEDNKSGSKWFADLTARHFWVKSDIDRKDGLNGYDVNRNFWAFSAEGGHLFYMLSPEFMNIGTEQHSHLSIEPKFEVRYKRGAAEHFTTHNGTAGFVNATEAFSTRFNLQMNYLPNGTVSTWKPYIELGVYNEWSGKTRMKFAGTNICSSDTSGIGFEATAGTNVTLSNDTYLYGAFTYEDGKVYTSYQGNVGLRMKF